MICFNGVCGARVLCLVGKESYFNYVLEAGGYDCFFEELLEGDNVEIDYQVRALSSDDAPCHMSLICY